MKEFKYVITDEMGIHARPAGLLVKAVKGYDCTVKMDRRLQGDHGRHEPWSEEGGYGDAYLCGSR